MSVICWVTVAAALLVPSAASATVPPVPETQILVSSDPVDETPHARDGEARAFAEIGSMVYVGGTFTQIRQDPTAAWVSQRYLFGYDKATGAISTTFLPVLDGAVNSLVAGPNDTLIVGGAFRNANGVSRKNLVALDPITGATVDSWVGRSDGGNVRDMALHGDWLYLAGAFNWVNGTPHAGLARLHAGTGAIDPTFAVNATVGRGGTSSYVWTIDVSPDGQTLVAGGNFTDVNTLSRNQMALVDLSGTPSVLDWSTEKFVAPCEGRPAFSYVQDVRFGGDGSWFVVGTNGGSGWPAGYCDALVRFETAARGDGQLGTWVNYTGRDTITSVEVVDNVIYLGGHFRWLNNPTAHWGGAGDGAIDRLGIAAVTPATGMPVNWNPRRSGGSSLPAGTSPWGSTVPVLWRGNDGLYFGHNSDGMGGEYHGRLGMFPRSSGRTITPKNPSTATSGNLYLGIGEGELARVPFDGTGIGAPTMVSQPNYTGAGATWGMSDRIYWAHTVAGTPTGSRIDISMFPGGVIGVPWESSGYNDWFDASELTGAFFLDGRLHYTRADSDALHYRYFETDGNYLGATEFTLPTTGVDWSTVRGTAWVDGRIVYGSTDGNLRSVPFRPAADPVVDGAESVLLVTASPELTWSTSRLFFAVQ